MGIKSLVSYVIKTTNAYQNYIADKYYNDPTNHYEQLEKDEINANHDVVFYKGDKCKQLIVMMDMIKITLRPENRFQVWIDTGLYVYHFHSMTDNVPPLYSLIIGNSLNDIIGQLRNYKEKYYLQQIDLLKGVIKYVNRIVDKIGKSISENPENINLKKTREYYKRMITSKAESLEEALQRILFWSSLFWQSQHRLVGLGRLDLILSDFSCEEVDRVSIISDFYREIHRYYAFKSSSTSLGDTGQIVILGGTNLDGTYFCNNLTYDFISALMRCKLPDPKILLRVSKVIPDNLLKIALKCIKTGIGCPLFANDDVVIPALIDFGYDYIDAHNYVTSACWEPLVYGNSLEKNNLKIINFILPLTDLILSSSFDNIISFDMLLGFYENELDKHVSKLLSELDRVKWEEDPLSSLFTVDCFKKGRDISQKGAKYNDYGILSVGLSNVINSLLIIKKFVFDLEIFSMDDLKDILINNYTDNKNLRKQFKENIFFGKDNDNVIKLTNEIIDIVRCRVSTYTNPLGGKVKFGLSASNYVEMSMDVPATPDGRKYGEPLRTHITAEYGISYTELISFASKINYSGFNSNGNVVDFFVAPKLIENNFYKFYQFIKLAISVGFYEMQMNVVGSKTLINAKNNPQNYQDLIVRVWGFSAYFKDLPSDYQDVLIERTLISESNT